MFEKLLKRLAAALESEKIPYMIIGGQAVLLYGEPRLTRDIDVTLGLGTEHLPKLLAIAKKLKLEPLPANPSAFVRKSWVLPLEDTTTKIRVDFIFSFTPYEKQAIKRAKDIKIANTKVKFASAEDVIIHKIFAGRPRDIEDVESILIKNPKINFVYIQKWLASFAEISPEKDLLKTFKNCLKNTKE